MDDAGVGQRAAQHLPPEHPRQHQVPGVARLSRDLLGAIFSGHGFSHHCVCRHVTPSSQPWLAGPLVPAGAAIRAYAVRGVPWGCPTHGALPATTECSRAQGRGQAPVRRGVRGKAGGGDASPSWEETAHACVAEASRSPSPSVSDADVWVSAAQRGCPARLSEGDPPARRALPRPASPSPPWICGHAQRASAPCTWAKSSLPSRTCAPSAPRCCAHGQEW